MVSKHFGFHHQSPLNLSRVTGRESKKNDFGTICLFLIFRFYGNLEIKFDINLYNCF